MASFEITRELLGQTITALILRFDEDIHVSIYGGCRPHIGSITIARQPSSISTTQFPGHKEAVVSEAWAEVLLKQGFQTAVVEAGIHYDGLSASGIHDVLNCSDQMLTECLQHLERP